MGYICASKFFLVDFVLEFLKSVGPAIVVFVTVYFMLNNYFAHERFKVNTSIMQKSNEQTLPLKLQAYERLALFLERAKISNLMLRFPTSESANEQWLSTLMLAVQQEYEHNLVQQIYVSDQLWSIIVLAKDELMHSLNQMADMQKNSNDSTKNFQPYIVHAEETIEKALSAIKQEVKIILNI